MRVFVAIAITAVLSGCSIRTSGLKPETSADGGPDGGRADARIDAARRDAGTDACLGCECRISADCAPARVEHTDCMPVASPTGPCDPSGTRQRIEISYLCNAGACRENRNMFGEACTVVTDGVRCGPSVVGSWSACIPSGCGSTGTRTRDIVDPICMGGTCGADSRTQSEECTVSTDGDVCSVDLDCHGRCRSGSCDRTWCDRTSDCSGLCPSGGHYCVLGCCRCP